MMSDYIKYQHVEKIGSDEVDGLLIGTCYVFPKIDGTNAQVWFDGEQMHYGSRRRELAIDADNAEFMASAVMDDKITQLCQFEPNLRVFGEWLVPHSLKTYKEDAWKRFYVFDIARVGDNGLVYLNYEEVRDLCEAYGVQYIAPLRIIKNPSVENLFKCLEENTFLIKDGEGCGEGIVIKNYDFRNKYGRTTWGKIVTSEFKEKHHKAMGAPMTNGTAMIEEAIAEEFVTKALVEKTIAKIKTENGGWASRHIGQLLGRVFHDLVTEHIWDVCKKHKNPKVDFKNLNRFCIVKVKQLASDLF